jgi:hypothetical protein
LKRFVYSLAALLLVCSARTWAEGDPSGAFLAVLDSLAKSPNERDSVEQALAEQVQTLRANSASDPFACPELLTEAGIQGRGQLTRANWISVFQRSLDVLQAMAPVEVAVAIPQPKAISFNKDIRPILSDNCFACHGPDSNKRKAGLRLDTEEGAFAALKSGHTVFARGNRADSELYKRITSTDPDEHMPPPSSHKQLTTDQIELLGRWIDDGAKYEKHWAFVPPKPQTPPEVADAIWNRNPVDRFVFAKLEEHALKPNPQAEKRILIRRAYLDLLGMPPPPDAVDKFLNDQAPDAYEKLIDELLGDPHFGERWGRHWLDNARFAESHGYEQDYDRPYAWHYRDFVIRAMNSDLPYDTFVKWQLAGDEFEPDNPEALKATGFLAAGVHSTQITLNQVEKERYDELDDMLRTIGTTMLGMTVGCARCHDHKYDPIPANDYYRALSTFTTTVRSDFDVKVDAAIYERKKNEFDAEHKPLMDALAAYEVTLRKRFEAQVDAGASVGNRPKWALLSDASPAAEGGATFALQSDGSWTVSGASPEFDTYTITASTPLKGVSAIRLDALADDSLPSKGPGRADNGNFALSRIHVFAGPADESQPMTEISLIKPQASFEQNGLPVAAALDDDDKSGWAVDGQIGKDQWALFEFGQPVSFTNGTKYKIVLEFKVNGKHAIGKPRIALTTSSIPIGIDGEFGTDRVVALLQKRGEAPWLQLSTEERDTLFGWSRTKDPVWKQLNGAIEEHAKLAPPTTEKVLISSEGVTAIRTHTQGGDFLENTHFLKRGDPNQKDAVATQSFFAVLMNGLPETHWQEAPPAGSKVSYRRRSMANWITDYENGAGFLLARVIVNRLWHYHFGQGIVATPSDFGFQGEAPSNPELLDWLAEELVRNGWHLKPIHKLIMTSATYMQSSEYDETKANADRMNKYLWHFARKRLDAESIRDSMLATSGMLDSTMFGPGTLDTNMRRRSVYFFVKRSRLIPMMMLFDGPDTSVALDRRASTTIAPQALMLMNNPTLRSYAEGFATRVLPTKDTNPDDAVKVAFMTALCRPPSEHEVAETKSFLTAQTQSYASHGEPAPEHRAMADFCQVLLSSNEFVYQN